MMYSLNRIRLYLVNKINHTIIIVIEECGYPPNLAHGQVLFTSTAEGSVATYICNEGYKLEGSSTRTCSSGNWSDSQPFCQGMHAKLHALLMFGIMQNHIYLNLKVKVKKFATHFCLRALTL